MARKRYRRRRSKLWKSIKKSEYTRQSDGAIISMDSSWEVACATRLDELGITWERDPSMKLPYTDKKKRKRNYIPDFYLPDFDLYIEVKGYWTPAAKHKMKDIMKRNPGKFCLLESLNSITTLSLPILATTGSVPS